MQSMPAIYRCRVPAAWYSHPPSRRGCPLSAANRGSIWSPCTFETDPTIRIGGLRAYNSEMGVMADETLDAMLEEQRGWFEENSGLTVAG